MRESAYLITTGNASHDAWALLRQTSSMLDEYLERHCRAEDLSLPAYVMLHVIKHGPKPMTAYRLAQVLKTRHNSSAQLARRLVKKGLLKRVSVNGAEGLETTDLGDKILHKIDASTCLGQIFSALEPGQVQHIHESLLALRALCLQALDVRDRGQMRLSPPQPTWQRPGSLPGLWPPPSERFPVTPDMPSPASFQADIMRLPNDPL